MDATATASKPPSATFGGIEPQKFDLATLLKNVAAAAAASSANSLAATASGATATLQQMAALTSSTATSPNSVESSASTNGATTTTSPSPPNPAIIAASSVADMKPISAASLAPPGVYQRRELSFTPIKPSYAPSGHGRQILVYDSRSHPGRRREFAYKTRFTNQSGLTTVYYRCMACRALRHRLQRVLPKDKLPSLQVPCIAVKNDLLINDPDFPDASDHFCSPLTIEESNQRLQNTFERGHKRARMKMANSAVEETIRKVGRLNAASAAEQQIGVGGMKGDEDDEGGVGGEGDESALSIDLWTKSADGTTMMRHGGEGGSECSSDSLVVDVIKEESPDEEEEHNSRGNRWDGQRLIPSAETKIKEENGEGDQQRHNNGTSSSTEWKIGNSSTEQIGHLNTKPSSKNSAGRSPRRKLDTLLRLAEMRAAASANGGGGAEAQRADLAQQQMSTTAASNCSVSSSSLSSTAASSSDNNSCRTHHQQQTLPSSFSSLLFNSSLGGLLGTSHQYAPPSNNSNSTTLCAPSTIHQQQQQQQYYPHLPQHNQQHRAAQQHSFNNSNNSSSANIADSSMQSIHSIASRLNRGGTGSSATASELSKALGGKMQQKGAFLMNGEKTGGGGAQPTTTAAQQHQMKSGATTLMNGNGQQQQQQQLVVGELLKKYVENNNMDMMGATATQTDNNVPMSNNPTRNAGELACAMFMAQMVENAELRQEVQKLRAELDSLKALVAAAAVVGSGSNNGFENDGRGGGTNSNGHPRHFH